MSTYTPPRKSALQGSPTGISRQRPLFPVFAVPISYSPNPTDFEISGKQTNNVTILIITIYYCCGLNCVPTPNHIHVEALTHSVTAFGDGVLGSNEG